LTARAPSVLIAANMGKLGIHLQNGFDGDEVVVRVNGNELMRRNDVRTRRILGLAAHEEFEVGDGPLSLDVSIPGRGVEKHIELDEGGNERYVGLSLEDGDLRVIQRSTPFGYG
jgi:hypothetical protein